MGTTRDTVIVWRRRFTLGGTAALAEDAPGRGRKPTLAAEKVQQIVDATLQTQPPNATHGSVRTMAKAQGVSPATVHRIWDAHGLPPHRVKTCKLSCDQRLVEKLTEGGGLYLNPPAKAWVLCGDEKSQIQARDRTPPGLPMNKGRCGTFTHDYKRHGTTPLFAALHVLEGTVMGECMARHRHQEFLKFLRKIDRETASGLDLHLIIDHYATPTHPRVKNWLRKHRRFHLHPTPTRSSWLNRIARWFRERSQKRLRRGLLHSVEERIQALQGYLEQNNKEPKPFVWTANVPKILQKVQQCRAVLETLH